MECKKVHAYGVLLPLVLLGTACVGIGPRTLPRDRFDYAEGLRESSKEQLLLNLVGLRYAETPTFLEVTSVINQYSLEGEISASAGFGTAVDGGNTQGIGGAGRWANRPTITYAPVTGAKFTREVLTPVPAVSLVSLTQSGWSVEFLFRLAVRSVNGIVAPSGLQALGAGDPRYVELIQALGRLQKSGHLGVRLGESPERETAFLILRRGRSPAAEEDIERIDAILGLDPEPGEYRLILGQHPKTANEIAIVTRSVFEILVELSAWIDVPPDHVVDGRAGPSRADEMVEQNGYEPMIRVRSSAEDPGDVFVGVRYKGFWYWIDHGDFASKRTFSFTQLLFSLTEKGPTRDKPVITVPAG